MAERFRAAILDAINDNQRDMTEEEVTSDLAQLARHGADALMQTKPKAIVLTMDDLAGIIGESHGMRRYEDLSPSQQLELAEQTLHDWSVDLANQRTEWQCFMTTGKWPHSEPKPPNPDTWAEGLRQDGAKPIAE